MELKLENVNKLPVRTFRWLGVNELNLLSDIPEIKAFSGNPLANVNEKDILINKKTFSGENIETGMGEDAVSFVEENKNLENTILVPKGKKIEKPIVLKYNLDEENKTLIDRNFIYAEEDSEVTLVIHYEGNLDKTSFHGGLTYLKTEKNASIHVIIIQMLDNESINFHDIGVDQADNSNIDIITVELGSKMSASGIHANLLGKESSFHVETIYLGDGERTLDFNYVSKHRGEKTVSNMDIHGALMDKSKKIFRGTIDFKNGASGAVGEEGEYTLLFGNNMKNVSTPLILCDEEDVSGSHAANSGRIDEEQLFYMMSRGMDKLSAKKTLIEAWFSPAIDKIPSEEIKEEVISFVKGRLEHVKSI